MPAPAPLVLGPAAIKAAGIAMEPYAPVAASSLTWATFLTIVVRYVWRRVPDWIKEDVSIQALFRGNRPEKQNLGLELDNLSSVLQKIQACLESGRRQLLRNHHPEETTSFDWKSSFIAYWAMATLFRIDKQEQQFRDETYKQQASNKGSVQMTCLKEYLDYATWAYYSKVDLQSHLVTCDWELLHHEEAPSRPGQLGYYIAISHRRKTLLIGVKGTSTLEDFVTDCCGKACRYDLFSDQNDDDPVDTDHDVLRRVEVSIEGPDQVVVTTSDDVEVVSGHERITVEKGQRRLEDHDDDHIIYCHEGIWWSTKRLAKRVSHFVHDWVVGREDYQLLLCGHSLGAGAASLLGLLLQSPLYFPSALDGKVQVYAFAPPPILDYKTALASSVYVTSIVNNADIIPRSSLANVTVFGEFLKTVSTCLEEQSSLSVFWRLVFGNTCSSDQLPPVEDYFIMTSQDVKAAITNSQNTVDLLHPEHLYVPGKVLLLYEPWNDKYPEGHRSYTWTDGTAPVLRFFEVDGEYQMFTDHLTASYYETIEALLQQEAISPLGNRRARSEGSLAREMSSFRSVGSCSTF